RPRIEAEADDDFKREGHPECILQSTSGLRRITSLAAGFTQGGCVGLLNNRGMSHAWVEGMLRSGTLLCDSCDREIAPMTPYFTAAVDPDGLAGLLSKLGLVTLP